MSIRARMSRAVFPGLVLALSLASSARAEPGSLPQTAAACQAVSTVEPPETDKPTQAQMPSLEGCDAEALFYGIGRPADPVQARLCAFSQLDRDDADPAMGFSGKDMLATIYANGVGAQRNLKYAIRLACDADAAPAEYDARVANLLEKEQSSWDGSDYSWCDNITSGVAGGACAAHQQRIDDQTNRTFLDSFASRLSGPAAASFDALKSAQAQWSTERAENEISMDGTAAQQFVIDEERLQDKDFVEMLQRLESGNLPNFGSRDFKAADAQLNKTYKAVQALPDDAFDGTVTKADIRSVQRVWLKYRDAWGDFAAAAYPKLGKDGAEAWVTRKRDDMLSAFLLP